MKTAFLFLFVSFHLCGQVPSNVESSLVLLNTRTGREKVILTEKRHFEAPNWSRDGQFLIINANGFLEKIDLTGKNLGQIKPGLINNCNNDHGLSFDGNTLIISRNEQELAPNTNSRIYAFPFATEKLSLVTPQFPSYWHGISPDGKNLVYCAKRNDHWDIYSVDVNGGEEKQLTNANGLDDGPEYSYDGQWIYFNSHRTGRMHLYRMKPDGSEQEQLTSDEFDNWFPHPSPNGRQVAYIAYLQDQQGRHPFGQQVKLRLLNVKTKKAKDLTSAFFGGQGTINVHSWSPDGIWIAFVRYTE